MLLSELFLELSKHPSYRLAAEPASSACVLTATWRPRPSDVFRFSHPVSSGGLESARFRSETIHFQFHGFTMFMPVPNKHTALAPDRHSGLSSKTTYGDSYAGRGGGTPNPYQVCATANVAQNSMEHRPILRQAHRTCLNAAPSARRYYPSRAEATLRPRAFPIQSPSSPLSLAPISPAYVSPFTRLCIANRSIRCPLLTSVSSHPRLARPAGQAAARGHLQRAGAARGPRRVRAARGLQRAAPVHHAQHRHAGQRQHRALLAGRDAASPPADSPLELSHSVLVPMFPLVLEDAYGELRLRDGKWCKAVSSGRARGATRASPRTCSTAPWRAPTRQGPVSSGCLLNS